MLADVDPRLHKIEALAEPGCYSLTFQLDGGDERVVVARMRGELAALPANAFADWPTGSASYQAVVAAVLAVHTAREQAGPGQARLVDVEGGWDVGLGNVVLNAGRPSCVSHGLLEQVDARTYRCPTCGAAACYLAGSASSR
ncbi:MAG TPA: hypothetical protein VJ851_03315 [Jatrophihabitans sp.]|jgi:hypothetical protein|nr:hypothetical protein [Jatrophihabitans sp.]